VHYPGTWNLEQGPDFMGAMVTTGRQQQRRLAGDAEIHIHPEDWSAHGHSDDPHYRQVRIHVTWYPGHLRHGTLPPGAIHIPLRDAVQADPLFAFDAIDIYAYPYAARTDLVPCARILQSWPAERKGALLDSAGIERIRRKTRRMQMAIEQFGPVQTLYEETCAALGYKNNRTPFRRLARLVPLDRLRRAAGHNPLKAYAILAGVSGLLPDHIHGKKDPETASFIRRVWDTWWQIREEWPARPGQSPLAWTKCGTRPLNHPLRRMMAVARLFTGKTPLLDDLMLQAPNEIRTAVHTLMDYLTSTTDAFWNRHVSLGSSVSPRPVHLIGRQRAADMITNIAVPFWLATGHPALSESDLLHALPAGTSHAVLHQTAYRLFGRDHAPRLYASALRRQGLIQIFQDFCLNDRSRCEACPLYESLQGASRM
jgi:hypothetical protein